MMIVDIIENEDNTVTLVVDMTAEEHKQLLTSAVVRALHLGLQEQKDIEAEYKK
jgi:hypothetical protein